MSEVLTWSGLTAVGLMAIGRFWAAIERPVLEFLALGILPGTDLTIGYEQVLLITLSLFLMLLALEHLSHSMDKQAKRRFLEQISL